jgi:hypothetical protein
VDKDSERKWKQRKNLGRKLEKKEVGKLSSNEDIAKQIVEFVHSHVYLGTHWTLTGQQQR